MLTVILLATAGLAALYLFCILPRLPRRSMSALLGYDYAHRGLWDNRTVPENSLPAFRQAAEHGFGIELDVRATADGIPAVFHDDSLERMCGIRRAFAACTLHELRAARLLDTDEQIPTFAEALQVVHGKVPIIVEIKSGANLARTCEQVDSLLQRYPGIACVQSFDPRAMKWFRKHNPQRIRGQLVFAPFRRHAPGRRLTSLLLSAMLGNLLSRPDYVAHEIPDSRNPAFRLVRKLGARAAVWPVSSQEQMDRLRGRRDLLIFEGFIPAAADEADSTAGAEPAADD
ncbi:MAG: glycerophosphodiester phosphodiesterase [Clostridia bacterium]|nr:glycerophosphodiester phosphodiesterase [Clostridia bacterium]